MSNAASGFITARLGGYARYPEHFREAFARWRAQEGEGTAPVCRTSVLDCLESLCE